MNESPSRIRAMLRTETECLEDYLLGNTVYRQIRVEEHGHAFQHLMSLGSYLEHQALWETVGPDHPDMARDTAGLAAAGDTLMTTFSTQVDSLGTRELKARLRSLQWSLEEWIREDSLTMSYFASEMAQRSRMQRIGDTRGWFGVDRDLKPIDDRIRTMTHAGPFIWNPVYSKAFPEEAYWFLYRRV